MASCITLFGGLFFITEVTRVDFVDLFAFFSIVLVNIYFILFWVYLMTLNFQRFSCVRKLTYYLRKLLLRKVEQVESDNAISSMFKAPPVKKKTRKRKKRKTKDKTESKEEPQGTPKRRVRLGKSKREEAKGEEGHRRVEMRKRRKADQAEESLNFVARVKFRRRKESGERIDIVPEEDCNSGNHKHLIKQGYEFYKKEV